jgi:hypothetical protein
VVSAAAFAPQEQILFKHCDWSRTAYGSDTGWTSLGVGLSTIGIEIILSDSTAGSYHISGTEPVDSKEDTYSIALEPKESIDISLPLAGEAVNKPVLGTSISLSVPKFGSVDGALGRQPVLGLLTMLWAWFSNFVVFIGKGQGGVWFGLKAKLSYPHPLPFVSQPQNHSKPCSSDPLLASDLDSCHVFQPATIEQYFHGGHVVHSGFARRDIAFIFLPWQRYDRCLTC